MIRKRNNPPPTVAQQYILDRVTIDCNGCWNWNRATDKRGYGRCHTPTRFAHHVSYEAFIGPLPTNYLMHDCDNPACVNPEHLTPGDHQQNMADAAARGLMCRGSAVGTSKLTEDQVASIKSDERPQNRIAADYGVSQSLVSRIKSGERWVYS